jgi:hypothetical protein
MQNEKAGSGEMVSVLINTQLQSGARQRMEIKPFQRLSHIGKTAEAVVAILRPLHTPLKQGVNESFPLLISDFPIE